ncbi:chorismate mutase [Kribbella aluminosa]|uniref:Chorismate mutase n=1 Tax=Kribbella aluminosa TaxID=416017 RepID=A0ABS4UK70_9ACTN|nr:gas vesicle protein GvpG [Kribbella aluminosa]MBP2352041.1 chorismate mutase [Kribbella aluminosa]
MGLLTGVLLLPLAPIRMTVAVADQLRRQALQEYYDPDRIRQQLDEIDRLRASGVLDEAEADALEEELVDRLIEGSTGRAG